MKKKVLLVMLLALSPSLTFAYSMQTWATTRLITVGGVLLSLVTICIFIYLFLDSIYECLIRRNMTFHQFFQKKVYTLFIFITLFIFSAIAMTISSLYYEPQYAFKTQQVKDAAGASQEYLDNNLKKKGVYCGPGIDSFPCGEYTFRKMIERNKDYPFRFNVNTACEGNSSLDGGGKVEVESNKYKIIPYDYKCENSLEEEIIISK